MGEELTRVAVADLEVGSIFGWGDPGEGQAIHSGIENLADRGAGEGQPAVAADN